MEATQVLSKRRNQFLMKECFFAFHFSSVTATSSSEWCPSYLPESMGVSILLTWPILGNTKAQRSSNQISILREGLEFLVKFILPTQPDREHKDTKNRSFSDVHDWQILPWGKVKTGLLCWINTMKGTPEALKPSFAILHITTNLIHGK